MAGPLGAALLSAGMRYGMRMLPHVSGYAKVFAPGHARARGTVDAIGLRFHASYGTGRGVHFGGSVHSPREFARGLGSYGGLGAAMRVRSLYNQTQGRKKSGGSAARRNRDRRRKRG